MVEPPGVRASTNYTQGMALDKCRRVDFALYENRPAASLIISGIIGIIETMATRHRELATDDGQEN
jgi:hypothetical protein